MADNQCSAILPPVGTYHGAHPGQSFTPESLEAFENVAGSSCEMDGETIILEENSQLPVNFIVRREGGSQGAIIIQIKTLEDAEGLIGQIAQNSAFSTITNIDLLKSNLARMITVKRRARIDYALSFLPYSSGLNFPTERANWMANRPGNPGVLLVRIEPWKPTLIDGHSNLIDSYPLKDIAAGGTPSDPDKYDEMARNFARGAIAFSREHNGQVPVWVSFAHEMNVERINPYRYPWAGDPEAFKAAYKRFVDVVREEFKASGEVDIINWVWNPNIDFPRVQDYYPGPEYVDWIAVDGYTTEDFLWSTWRPFPLLFSTAIAQLSFFGKPLMIAEYAADFNSEPGDPTRTGINLEKKSDFIASAHTYMALDGRVKASSWFNESKMEAGNPKRYAIDDPSLVLTYHLAMEKYGALYQEGIKVATGLCDEVRSRLTKKEELTPKRLFQDRMLTLDQLLQSVILPSELIVDGYSRGISKDPVSRWLSQKAEMSKLVEGLVNGWFIYREIGKPADPAVGCTVKDGKSCFDKSNEVMEGISKKLDFNFLQNAPDIPYLIDTINLSIGSLKIRSTGEGEETRSGDKIKTNEKIAKKRALSQLANISLILSGELSERDNRLVLASMLETYLPTLLEPHADKTKDFNAIHDRVLRLSITHLLLGLEGEYKLSDEDRQWVLGLELRDKQRIYFSPADSGRLLVLVKEHFQDPIVAPLIAELRSDKPIIDKPTQLIIFEVVQKMFVNPVKEVEKSLHDGNILDTITLLEKNGTTTDPEKQKLKAIMENIEARRKQAEEEGIIQGRAVPIITTTERDYLTGLMNKYFPDIPFEVIYPNLMTTERPFFKKKSALYYGKSLAMQGFIAKDFTDMSTEEVVSQYFDRAFDILKTAVDDPYTDQADISEIYLWMAKIVLVKAGLEKNLDTEFDMLQQSIDYIDQTKVDMRNLQLHTQEIERMQAEAYARQGFIRKEQKREYEPYFAKAKEKLATVQAWGDAYKALLDGQEGRGTEEPLWAQQTIALAQLWTAKIRLVELGEEKQDPNESRTVTIQHQGEELVKLETLLTEATAGLETEPALQADVWRSLGEQQVRLAYAKKDLGIATEAEIQDLAKAAQKSLDKALQQGVALTRSEGYYWLAKALLLQADYAKTRDEELEIIHAAGNNIDKALEIAPTTKEIKGRSLSALYAAKGEILMKQNQFKAAVVWFTQAIATYPKNYDAIISLADIYSWQREYVLAEASYKSILDDEPAFKAAGKARFSDELAFDQARLGSYELTLRKDRQYAKLFSFANQLLQTEAPASYLRKRATLSLIELYSQRQTWYDKIFDLYHNLTPALISDRQFYYEVIRRTAEAHGGQRDFAKGRQLLKDNIPKDYWREKTALTDAELEMRGWRHTLPWLRPSLVTAVNNILENRQDDPMLVAQALSDLYEAYATAKDFKGMIAVGDILLGKNFSPEARPKVQERFPLLDNNLLPKAFANFSDKALVVAQVQMRSKLADALIWERNHYAEARQVTADAQKYLETAGSDLPAIEKAIYSTDLLIKLGDIYRFGKKLKDPTSSRENYNKAVDTINPMTNPIPQEWDDIALLLSRAYLGWAKLEQQESHPSLAREYLVKAKRALLQIKLPPRSLDGEESRAEQNILEQQLSIEYNATTDNSDISETRTTVQVRAPFLGDWIAPAVTEYVDNTGTTRLSTTYAGAVIKPFGQQFGIESHFKLPGTQYSSGSDTPSFPQYSSYPDVSLSGTAYTKPIVSTLSTDLFFDPAVKMQNTYYGKMQLNIGGITQNPYLDLRIGPVFNQYHSNYEGNWQDHWFGGITADWGIDPAAFLRWIPFDLLRFGVDGTLPISEYAIEPQNELTNKSWRTIINGEAPFSGHLTGTINFGQYGKCSASIGGTTQQAADYNYSRTETNFSCTINSFGVYNLLNLGR